jgi:hypothetical protein
MGNASLFSALSSQSIAGYINCAQKLVCYVAPGIHDESAKALVALKINKPNVAISVSLDFDEHTLRMGYGSFSAVKLLKDANLIPTHSAGFRSAILIVDNQGWVFTPTSLYLEAEPQSDETPNAIRLTAEQVKEILLRLSPAAREEAIAATPAEAVRLKTIPLEVSEIPLDKIRYEQVKKSIEIAPPVKFDIVRQVRVFEPYLQYVELSLTGVAVQRNRVRIPESLQNLGVTKDIKGKLKTTFDLIERDSTLSSKELEDELNEIRKNFTRMVNGERVALKSAKPKLLERLAELRVKLAEHQAKVKDELQEKLDESKKQVVEHYLPLVNENPPDAMHGDLSEDTEEARRKWIDLKLSQVFPTAEELTGEMSLTDSYKDVTFETLNNEDFIKSLKISFPCVDWEKPYNDFKAAAEVKSVTKKTEI